MAWSADGTWKPEQDSVASQVTGLMSQDSPLMRKAQSGAMATANRRGLLNSSIAAEAGEKAALDYVVPIASQQAQQIYGANINSQNIAADTAKLDKTLSSEEARAANSLTAQREMQTQQLATQKELQTEDLTSQEKRAAADLAAKERATVADMNAKLAETYTQGIARTLDNDKINAQTRNTAQADIAKIYSDQASMVKNLYGVNLNWQTQGGLPVQPATPGAPVPAPATPAPSTPSTPAPTQPQTPGVPDYTAYLKANPDVMASYAKVSKKKFPTPESYAQYHYTTYGQKEGRPMPTGTAAAAAAPAPAPAATRSNVNPLSVAGGLLGRRLF